MNDKDNDTEFRFFTHAGQQVKQYLMTLVDPGHGDLVIYGDNEHLFLTCADAATEILTLTKDHVTPELLDAVLESLNSSDEDSVKFTNSLFRTMGEYVQGCVVTLASQGLSSVILSSRSGLSGSEFSVVGPRPRYLPHTGRFRIPLGDGRYFYCVGYSTEGSDSLRVTGFVH